MNHTHLEAADLTQAHLEGAQLWKAHFEGAVLENAHFAGVFSSYSSNSLNSLNGNFENNIRQRIKQNSEIDNVYTGGLDIKTANKLKIDIAKRLEDTSDIQDFNDKIEDAINRVSNINLDAITGELTVEMADEIIEKYNKSMGLCL